jgi:hypothetical protein
MRKYGGLKLPLVASIQISVVKSASHKLSRTELFVFRVPRG